MSHFFAFHDLQQSFDGPPEVVVEGIEPGVPFDFSAQIVFGQPNSVRITTDVRAEAFLDRDGSVLSTLDFSGTVS